MFTELLPSHYQDFQSDEKMIIGALEGKLVATKILLKQGMAWTRIAELMDMTEEQIACVQRDFH